MISFPIYTSRLCRGQVDISETIWKSVTHTTNQLGIVGFKVENIRPGHIGEANGGGSK